jgi:hypothetical protein
MPWGNFRMTFPAGAIFMGIYEVNDEACDQRTPHRATRAEPLAALVGIMIP